MAGRVEGEGARADRHRLTELEQARCPGPPGGRGQGQGLGGEKGLAVATGVVGVGVGDDGQRPRRLRIKPEIVLRQRDTPVPGDVAGQGTTPSSVTRSCIEKRWAGISAPTIA
ncbi:MAG: hypothetical protein NVS9B1_01140 [Candidatus Dormibacteraceae bacterium]